MPARYRDKAATENTPYARAKGAQGFGAPLHYSWGWRELPGAGAGQYAFETLALPRYSAIGNGVRTNQGWMYDQPVLYALQGVNLEAIGSPGVKTGGFYAAPLTDTQDNGIAPDVLRALQTIRSYQLPGGVQR